MKLLNLLDSHQEGLNVPQSGDPREPVEPNEPGELNEPRQPG